MKKILLAFLIPVFSSLAQPTNVAMPLVFENVTVSQSFQKAQVTLSAEQLDFIVSLVQNNGISANVQINSTNLYSLVIFKQSGTNAFTLSAKLQ